MRKFWIIFGCLCLLLALTAGLLAATGRLPLPSVPEPPAESAAAPETSAPTSEPTSEPTPEPLTLPDGTSLAPDAEALALDAPDAETIAALCALELPALRELRVENRALAPEEALALREAFPAAALRCTLSLFGRDCPADLTELTLTEPAQLAESEAFLPRLAELLPALQTLRVPNETPDGVYEAPFPPETLAALRDALPESVALECSFLLFGQRVSSSDEEIVYEKAGLKPDDLDTVRRALPLLTSCHRFVLDNCGPSYEQLAALRDEFPEKNVVWRVHLNQDSLLTDAKVLWSIYVRDENAHVLNYCTELEYIDLGHDEWFSDISFTAYMPKLKVLIIPLTGVKDISPLANCPELEYLEIFRTEISDLSPLASCTKLEHLNISSMYNLRDISPLYGLTNLKRLWSVFNSQLPYDQREEIKRRLPDCEFRFFGDDCTANGWRTDGAGRDVERYALLKQQIGYNGYNSPADKIDWDKTWRPGYA